MSKTFNIRRYKIPTTPNGKQMPDTLVDGSDYLANQKQLVISFKHVPSGKDVFFKAFITSFNESYSSNFNPTVTFGRTDPIYQYSNTTRNISLSIQVPAASQSEAYENLVRVSKLEKFLYPSYTTPDVANTITQAPLIRMKVMNLLQDSRGYRTDAEDLFTAYISDSDPDKGLLGVVTSLAVDHNLGNEEGSAFFKEGNETKNTILPKLLSLQINFSPIHEETIGWRDKEEINSLFPYGTVEDEDRSISIGDRSQLDRARNRGRERIIASEEARRQKAEDEKRRIRQQTIDNAKARYGGFLGTMLFKADARRMARGNERAEERIDNLIDAAKFIREDEGEEAYNQFVNEVIE